MQAQPRLIVFRTISIFAGGVLLVAALAKSLQAGLDGYVVDAAGWLDSPLRLGLLVQFEIVLGCWLLSGIRPHAARWVAAATFSLFAVYSIFAGLAGRESCGCFGSFSPSPWIVAFVDIAIVGGLVSFRLPEGSSEAAFFNSRRSVALLALVAVGLSVGASVSFARAQGSVSPELGRISADGKTIILDPEAWEGRPLRLLDWIESDVPLDSGEWSVLLHRPGCEVCESKIEDLLNVPSLHRVALISVAHSTADDDVSKSAAVHGELNDEFNWIVEVPLQIRIVDGLVASVER